MNAPASSVAEVREAISGIIDRRMKAAHASLYDWKVCVVAVGAAADLFKKAPQSGTAQEYGRAVHAALGELRDVYYDEDGEYTSGKSDIGTIVEQVGTYIATIENRGED